MKKNVFFVTAFIQLVVAVPGFLGLLLGLNGFSEDQAMRSLVFYIALALLSAFGLGAASAYTATRLTKKLSLGKFMASTIAIIGFAIIGVVILFVGLIAAVFLAEAIRIWK